MNSWLADLRAHALCQIAELSHTGVNTVYFLKQKSDTVEATEKFLADTGPFGKIKRIQSDNGMEFMSQNLVRTSC